MSLSTNEPMSREIEGNTNPFEDFRELYKQMLKKANDDNCEINININIKIHPLKPTTSSIVRSFPKK